MSVKSTLIGCLLHHAAHSSTGIVFIKDSKEPERLSYKDLYRDAMTILGNLQSAGIRQRDEIIFQVEDPRQFLLLFWACLLGNFIPVPLTADSQPSTRKKLLYVWKKMLRAVVVTGTGHQSSLEDLFRSELSAGPSSESVPVILTMESLVRAEEPGGYSLDITDIAVVQDVSDVSGLPNSRIASVSPDDIAYIQFSSGSTGSPKGVILTHANLIANTTDIIAASGIRDGDASLSWMPLTHDMGMICFHLSSLVAGIDQYIMPTSLFIRRPVLWIDKISEHRITHSYSPNFGYHYFLNAFARSKEDPGWDLSPLRLIYNGAEPISPVICRRFTDTLRGWKLDENVIFPGYGLAEASVAVTLSERNRTLSLFHLDRNAMVTGAPVRKADREEDRLTFVGVGYPILQCHVRICDEEDLVLRDGCLGNIQIKGANVTSGYYQDENATRELFTRDGWLRTGDIGFLEEGQLVITGRKKNIIIINGQNYYPQDIERAVESLSVLEPGKVAACSIPNDGDPLLVIFILYKDKLDDFRTLARDARRKVVEHTGLIAGEIIPVRKIPKTTSGKVKYFELVQRWKNGDFDKERNWLAGMERSSGQQDNYGQDRSSEQERDPGQLSLQQPHSTLRHFLDIWERNFGYLPEDITTNFTASGVNSLQAIALLGQLNERMGISLSIRDFFDHPSIQQLCEYIDSGVSPHTGSLPVFTPGILPVQEIPLLAAQKRFWLLHQYDQWSKRSLNLHLACCFTGDLQTDILEKALRCVIHRHESLRTSFVWWQDTVRQVIHPPAEVPFTISITDLMGREHAAEQARIILDNEADQPFDLETAPLCRARLVRTTATEYWFVLTVHHIIADGRSLEILSREVSVLYHSFLRNEAPVTLLSENLPPVSLPPVTQYASFVQWYNGLTHPGLSADADYWTRELAGSISRLELPIYKSPGADRSFEGSTVNIPFSSDLYKELTVFCGREGITLYMMLVSVLQLLLHKYSEQETIHIATNTSGRLYPSLENTVGCLINLAILKTSVLPEDRFADLLDRARFTIIEALQHQTLYLEDLPALHPQEGTSGAGAALDVFAEFQNFGTLPGWEGLQHDSLTVQRYWPSTRSTLSDLFIEFVLDNGKEELLFMIRYKTSLLDESGVRALATHFFELCHKVIKQPQALIMDISLLSEKERLILSGWGKGLSRPEPFIPVTKYLEQHAHTYRDRIGLLEEGRQLNWDDLNIKANRSAQFLLRSGIRKGDRVGLMMDRSIESVVLTMGILKSGANYVPVAPDYPADRIKYIFEDCRIRLCFTDGLPCRYIDHDVLVPPARWKAVLESGDAAEPSVAITGSDAAYILYTSGSSGRPKGVLIEHHSLSDYAMSFVGHFRISPEDRILHQAALTFDISVEEIFPAVVAGSPIVIAPEGGRDITRLVETIRKEQVSVVSTSPIVIRELNAFADQLSSIRVLISGGDRLRPGYIDKLLAVTDIYNTYGPTETTVCATYHKITSAQDITLIGKPIPNRSIYLLNRAGQLQVIGGRGEIFIGGKGLAREYINREDLTRSVFIHHPEAEGRLYRTGDWGRWTRDGNILFEGRSDHQVKISGHRVEPGEIEQALTGYGPIREAAVIAGETKGGLHLFAFYTSSEELATERLISYLADHLPSYMIPLRFFHIPRMPYTENGKLDYPSLRLLKNDWTELPAGAPDQPVSELQARLLSLWMEVLDKDDLRMDDHFFESGGDSIRATRVIHTLIKEYQVDLNLSDIFRAPTIVSLSALIESLPVSGTPVAALPLQDHYDLSAAQKRMWIIEQRTTDGNPYIMNGCYRIGGTVNTQALASSLRELVTRHESLRTAFFEVGGEPMQKIFSEAACDMSKLLEEIRLEHKDENKDDPEENAKDIIAAKLREKFDLSVPPLLRVTLIHPGEEKSIMLVRIHHIISDGLSMDIFARELLEAYYGVLRNEDRTWHPLPVQYKEYVHWQKQWLLSDAGKAARKFWHQKLQRGPSLLDLFADNPDKGAGTYEGHTIRIGSGERMAEKLLLFTRERSYTVYITLMAVVHILLFHYTRRHKLITVGTPFSGRALPEFRDLVGLFLNNIVIQSSIDPDEPFSSYLGRMKDYLTEASVHQHYPYDRLAEELYGFDERTSNPFYEILVVHQQSNLGQIIDSFSGERQAFRMTDMKLFNPVSKLGLTFFFREEPDQLYLELEYNVRIFSKGTIDTLAADFFILLDRALQGTHLSLSDLTAVLTKHASKAEHLRFEQDSLQTINDDF